MNCKKNKKNIILIHFQTKYKIPFTIILNKLLTILVRCILYFKKIVFKKINSPHRTSFPNTKMFTNQMFTDQNQNHSVLQCSF